MNKVKFKPFKNEVTVRVIRIESAFSFVSPYQTVDNPKEREGS